MLSLILFDMDGTLIDSQDAIVSAMAAGFGAVGLPVPARPEILSIVGLSLPRAIEVLAPSTDAAARARIAEAYRGAFQIARSSEAGEGAAPLYPGAREVLEALAAEPETLLGVATGKARRGLEHVLDVHDLRRYFQTTQCADPHPSKPHPAMLHAALSDTGVEADRAVMIGDTSFDMEMAAAAGMAAIGVTWGYHPAERLRAAGADCLIDSFAALPAALASLPARAA
ncbi:MAG: HAD-IA family hydrolase [Pseudomonadota bacterium]